MIDLTILTCVANGVCLQIDFTLCSGMIFVATIVVFIFGFAVSIAHFLFGYNRVRECTTARIRERFQR